MYSKHEHDRHSRELDERDRKSFGRGVAPSNGLAGKVWAAASAAPDDASDLQILAVAQAAWDRRVTVDQIWAEVRG